MSDPILILHVPSQLIDIIVIQSPQLNYVAPSVKPIYVPTHATPLGSYRCSSYRKWVQYVVSIRQVPQRGQESNLATPFALLSAAVRLVIYAS